MRVVVLVEGGIAREVLQAIPAECSLSDIDKGNVFSTY